MKNCRHWLSSTGFSPLAIPLVLVFAIFLLLRNTGLYPAVMADEWHYSALSRLIKISASSDPDYLYLALFRLTNYCGDGYLQCARVINVAWLMLGAFFVYLVAKRSLSRAIAVSIAAGSVLLPFNAYTAYFMPESMYFGVFWALVWFALAHYRNGISRYSVGLGILLATLSLVKPHGLFLLPGFVGFIGFKSYTNNPARSLSNTASTVGSFLATTLAVRLFVGYMIAGNAGLSLFGHRYMTMASDSNSFEHVIQSAISSVDVLWHHLVALTLMFGLPIAVLVSNLLSVQKWKSDATSEAFSVKVLAALLIAPLLVVTAVFTVLAVGTGPYEAINRLHMRYYDFTFPFFFIVAAANLSRSGDVNRPSPSRVIAAIAVGGAALYGLITLREQFMPSLVDGPELRAVTYNSHVFLLLGSCGVLALLIWSVNAARGANFFIKLFFPLFLVVSLVFVTRDMRTRVAADDYDNAGEFARLFLSASERSKLLVVGPELASLFRTIFYVDNPSASLLQVNAGTPLTASAIPPGYNWILVIGDHGEFPDATVASQAGRYILLKVDDIDFSKSLPSALVDSADGLSTPESIGTWSISDRVSIAFHKPLPKRFTLKLNALAFGPNVGQRVAMTVGHDTKSFKLSSSLTSITLSFDNAAADRTITIVVPQPTSPKSLGLSGDERRLGVRFVDLQIFPEGIH